MKRLSTFFLILILLSIAPLAAQVTFEGMDLDSSGILLFSANTDSPVFGEYTALFSSYLQERAISQLTYFPEQITLLSGGDQIQIQNRFGVFRTEDDFANLKVLEDFPAFIAGGEIGVGKTPAMAVSPDGRYLVFQNPRSSGYADLYLRDLAGDEDILLAEGVELRFGGEEIAWSKDSRFFVYAKGKEIFYYSVKQQQDDRVLPEEYRSLGSGGIRSVFWSEQGDLFLVSGTLVYKILGAELFTSTLYRNLMERGTLVGKIPFEFDANFDGFWVSGDGGKILLNKGERNFFLYYLQDSDFLSTGGEIVSLPYLYLPRNTRVKEVLWSAQDMVTLNTESIENGDRKTRVYRLNLNSSDNILSFSMLEDSGVKGLSLSPDGTRVAVMLEDRVIIRDYQSWKVEATMLHPEPLDVLWIDSSEVLIAGRNYCETWQISGRESEIVFLSQVDSFGFEKITKSVVATVGGRNFRYGIDGKWAPVDDEDVKPRQDQAVSSPKFRVYLDSSPDVSYTNQVMVRLVAELGTVPLFDLPEKSFDPFPIQDEPLDPYYFSHGSRVRRREVSLVFNAVDSADGLTEVLSTLEEYGLKATFFLNGEFIRRNPDAAREIALSGHEVGSLFYSYFNMTDSRYIVDKDFIKKGLARNEDDYFASTGRELSLLWHSPYYVVNSDILGASQEMNYDYIGRDVDPLDWVVADPSIGLTEGLTVPQMVDRIITMKKPGSVIPVRLGINDQRTGGYLYNNLDVLLNALLEEGYTVVPVSTLMEHTR